MPNQKKTIWQIKRERIAQGAHSAYRYTQRFWVNLMDDDDFELAEIIETLKTVGEFTSTVKRGIRLVASLDAGRMDVLFDLFPMVKSRILRDFEKVLNRHTQTLEAEIVLLRQQLEDASIKPIVEHKPSTSRANFDKIGLVVEQSDDNNDDAWENAFNAF